MKQQSDRCLEPKNRVKLYAIGLIGFSCLLVCSYALEVTGATLAISPEIQLYFKGYGTYLSWNQTLYCASFTISDVDASFSSVSLGNENVLSNVTLSQQGANLTLTHLLQNGTTTVFVITNASTTTSTTTFSSTVQPVQVLLDNNLKSINDEWTWNNTTLTFTADLNASQPQKTWTLVFPPITENSRFALASLLVPISLSISLIGLIPIVLTLIALVKFELDFKTFISIVSATIFILLAVLVMLYFVSAASST